MGRQPWMKTPSNPRAKTIIIYPSPGIGHLISMVEFGKLLLTQDPSLEITILTPNFPFITGSTSPYISSVSSAFPSITFHSLPPVPLLLGHPSNYAHLEQIIYENIHSNNPNVQNFIESITNPSHVCAFILDFFCYPALDVVRSFNIPTYFFFTSGASCLAFFLNFPSFDKIAKDSFRNLGDTLFRIPSLFSVPASHWVESMLDRGVTYDEFVKMSTYMIKSDGIIVNSFDSLEPRAVKALNEGTCTVESTQLPPLFCVGPLIAKRGNNKEKIGEVRNECLVWLDLQPNGSVVYLGFGSRGLFSKEQIREIAVGLEKSEVRFLWIVRAPPSDDKSKQFRNHPEPDLGQLLPSGFLVRTKDRGLVVKSWAPQIKILAHDAVGAFVTHCGWNSILEAVCAGVPMIAWPLYAEQRFNRILLVEDLKIALPMYEDKNRSVNSDEIEKRVRQIMNSDEGDVIRKNMKILSDEAKIALSEEGSSIVGLAKFVELWK